ncbi:ATP-dependent DNA helicase Rep [subsurface metagenome]
MYVEKVIGPPGTGKTTALIKRVEAELASGVAPERLGYYSFTRAAARVAQQRAQAAFPGYSRESFPHFRTLHSEAFQQLDLTKDMVMVGKNLQEFSKAFGYEISQAHIEDEDLEEHEVKEVVLKTLGDYLLFFTNWRANLMLELEPAYRAFWELHRDFLPDGWFLGVVRLFEARYLEYKEARVLLDFNDMLTRVLEEGPPPALDVLVFDEAQDSSPLQYKILDFWLQGVKRHYIGGDPDQCIYQWMGTDPGILMGRPCDRLTHLVQSYRVPQAVHRLATGIIHTTDYKPRPAPGEVCEMPLEGVLNRFASLNGNSAFILVRNLYLLGYLIEEIYQWGIPFENLRGPAPFKGKTAARILISRRLFRGESVSAADLWLLIKNIPQKPNFLRGFKAETQTMAKEKPQLLVGLKEIKKYCLGSFLSDPIGALGLSPRNQAYFKRVIQRYGEDILLREPQLIIGTIHSVKGMEADYVAVCSDMSRKTWVGWQRLPDEEKRIWYVAATRARESLFLIQPWGEHFWTWPKVEPRLNIDMDI